MDSTETTRAIWPASGGIVNYVNEDGSVSRAVIGHVKAWGDYPIVALGVFTNDDRVTRWCTSKFDPDADRPGSWHNIIREEAVS